MRNERILITHPSVVDLESEDAGTAPNVNNLYTLLLLRSPAPIMRRINVGHRSRLVIVGSVYKISLAGVNRS